MGMSCSTANRRSILTSTSCGWAVSGSQKKTTTSMRPSAMSAPSCASPPVAAVVPGKKEMNAMAHDTSTLPAQKRDQSGKGPARRLRAKGLVPAICYGPFDKEPLRVAVDPEALSNAIATPHKFNTVITLQVDGGETRTVLFKAFEKDPVDGHVLHADF